ncbi:MAG: hypothetical protein AAF957_24585 [Planctomycetota bacterium]
MLPAPLAIFGSIHLVEILVIGGAALMIFGPRLPEVALRATAHVMRARRAVSKMWRDTGLEEELRRVRRDIELSVPRDADFDVRGPAGRSTASSSTAASPEALAQLEDAYSSDPDAIDPDGLDPDAERANEEPFPETTIEPADGIIASGDLAPDADADRREPTADVAAAPVDAPADPVDEPAEDPAGNVDDQTAGADAERPRDSD